jgi:hypothetical protein
MSNISLPNSWDDVYADQYIQIYKVNTVEYVSRNIEILSILTDKSTNDSIWDDMDIEELDTYIENVKFLKEEPSTNFNKTIENLTYKNVYTMTLGEFIDLDSIVCSGSDDFLFKMCSILYRKTKKDEFDNIVFEPYGSYDIKLRVKIFEELPITNIYGIIYEFIKFKDVIKSSYPKIFNNIPIDDELDETEYSEYELEKIKEEEKIEKEQNSWAWEDMIYELTNGDITKYDAITDLPLIFVLNQVTFIKRFKK